MLNTATQIFNTSGFMPHGHCFLWTPLLLWSYVVSDMVIALSYYSIPLALWYFARKRSDLPFRWVFLLFGIFVMACGTTHLFAIWNIWEPNYWADAGIKGITAVASIITATALWPLIPRALAIPSSAELAQANLNLHNEMRKRREIENQLQETNQMLERRVTERTAELESANRKLLQEVVERKHSEESLRLRDRAIEASINGIMIFDSSLPDRPVIYVNPAVEHITGYTAQEVVGRNGRFLVRDDKDQTGLAEIRAALREGRPASAVIRSYRKDGSLFWNELFVAPVRNDSGQVTHSVSIINDVTDRIRYEEELEHQANHDALTGLANRNLLDDRLDQAIASAYRYERLMAVVYLDLDNFKVINDSLGHKVGDELVKMAAQRLSRSMREVDTVARIGGDEFVLVFSDAKQEEMVTVALQRIQEAIAAPFAIEEQELYVTCSMGASLFPRDGRDGQTLLKNADAAMYQAKEHGRNTFRFYISEMNAMVTKRLTLERGLRHALERAEFVLHYQPQIDFANGAIFGAEALVRWQHPDLGLLAPDHFIQVAEETGLIVPIGEWVMDTACAQNATWQKQGLPPIVMAVNLSARQFRQENLSVVITRVLERHGLQPRWLELELTESMVMQNAEQTVATLRELNRLGVRIALDDFGTGYSSLNYLKRFPIDKLKIDQSFVRDLTRDPDDAAIVLAIIAMAHSLNLKVIAEGVETREQFDYLQSHNCDEVQGYYFSKPVPAHEFAELLRDGNGKT